MSDPTIATTFNDVLVEHGSSLIIAGISIFGTLTAYVLQRSGKSKDLRLGKIEQLYNSYTTTNENLRKMKNRYLKFEHDENDLAAMEQIESHLNSMQVDSDLYLDTRHIRNYVNSGRRMIDLMRDNWDNASVQKLKDEEETEDSAELDGKKKVIVPCPMDELYEAFDLQGDHVESVLKSRARTITGGRGAWSGVKALSEHLFLKTKGKR